MNNPFQYGDPVQGEYYLPRPELENFVHQFLTHRIHVVLIGPRRFGKTSFVCNLLRKLEKEDYACLFVDIFNITSHQDFLKQMLRSLKEKKSWVEQGKKWLSSWKPKITAETDPISGQTSFGLSIEKSAENDVKEMIQDMLSGLKNFGKKVVLVLDEFQKIAELDDKGWLEATVRTHMQQLRNVSFLFTGSRKSLIADMLNNSSRPLYRSCQPIEFPSFGDEFVDWIIERFAEVNIEAEREAILYLKKMVQDVPNYVQMVCYHLAVAGYEKISHGEVEVVLKRVVQQNGYTYQTLMNSLSSIQQRALRLAAKHRTQIYAKEFLAEYELNAPALSSALNSLKTKGILDEEGTAGGTVIFDDPLFALWLKIAFDS